MLERICKFYILFEDYSYLFLFDWIFHRRLKLFIIFWECNHLHICIRWLPTAKRKSLTDFFTQHEFEQLTVNPLKISVGNIIFFRLTMNLQDQPAIRYLNGT